MTQDTAGSLLTTQQTGIPITEKEFRGLVAEYLQRMQAGGEMSTQDIVMMVRLWNTIELDQLSLEDELYSHYARSFAPAYIERIAKRLHAQPTKGMALYAKEYDLYIGGMPHSHSKYALQK